MENLELLIAMILISNLLYWVGYIRGMSYKKKEVKEEKPWYEMWGNEERGLVANFLLK